MYFQFEHTVTFGILCVPYLRVLRSSFISPHCHRTFGLPQNPGSVPGLGLGVGYWLAEYPCAKLLFAICLKSDTSPASGECFFCCRPKCKMRKVSFRCFDEERKACHCPQFVCMCFVFCFDDCHFDCLLIAIVISSIHSINHFSPICKEGLGRFVKL